VSTKLVYDFEWDIGKALANATKHGIMFDQAATVFLDAMAITVYDVAHSQSEDRWVTLGRSTSGVLLAVAHTFHETGLAEARIRIISARAATPRERRYYEEEPR